MASEVAVHINMGCIALVCQGPLLHFIMGFHFAVVIISLLLLASVAAIAFDPGLSLANDSSRPPSLWKISSPGDSRVECYKRSRPLSGYSCHNAWNKIEPSVQVFRVADRELPESHAIQLPYRWLSGKLCRPNPSISIGSSHLCRSLAVNWMA